jgi:hypothetical protein
LFFLHRKNSADSTSNQQKSKYIDLFHHNLWFDKELKNNKHSLENNKSIIIVKLAIY